MALSDLAQEPQPGIATAHHEMRFDGADEVDADGNSEPVTDGVVLAAGTAITLTVTRYLQGVHPELAGDVQSDATALIPGIQIEELGTTVDTNETDPVPVDGAPDVNGEAGYTTITITRQITITDDLLYSDVQTALLALNVTWVDNADGAWVATEPVIEGVANGMSAATPVGDGTCVQIETAINTARELKIRQ